MDCGPALIKPEIEWKRRHRLQPYPKRNVTDAAAQSELEAQPASRQCDGFIIKAQNGRFSYYPISGMANFPT